MRSKLSKMVNLALAFCLLCTQSAYPLAPRSQAPQWQEILQTMRGDKDFGDLMKLAERRIIKSPLDVRLLRASLAKWRPVFEEHTVSYLAKYYPFFKRVLRKDLEFCWPGVLELMIQAAQSSRWDGFEPMAVVARAVCDHKRCFNRQFLAWWPHLLRMAKASGDNVALVFPYLDMLSTKLLIKPGKKLEDIASVVGRLDRWYITRFLDTLLPQIKKLAGPAWDSDWPSVKKTLCKIDAGSMRAFIISLAGDHQSQDKKTRLAMKKIPGLLQWAQCHPDLISQFGIEEWLLVYKSFPREDAVSLLTGMSRLSALGVIHGGSAKDDLHRLAAAMAKLTPRFGMRVAGWLRDNYQEVFLKVFKDDMDEAWSLMLDILSSGTWQDVIHFGDALSHFKSPLQPTTMRALHRYFPALRKIFGNALKTQFHSLIEIFSINPANTHLVVDSLEKLEPILKAETAEFLNEHYNSWYKSFGNALREHWPGIVELLIASAGAEIKRNRDNLDLVAKGILSLKNSFKDDFLTFWPVIARLGSAAGEHSWAVLRYLPLLRSKFGLHTPQRLEEVGDILVDLRADDGLIRFFLGNLLPLIKKLEGKKWDSFRSSDAFLLLMRLNTTSTHQLQIIMQPWQWRFKSIAEIGDALVAMEALDEKGRRGNDAAVGWYIKTRFKNLCPDKVSFLSLWYMIDANSMGSDELICLMSMLKDVSIKDRNDFQLATAAAKYCLEKYSPKTIRDTQPQLLFEHGLNPIDFATLYPLMLEHRLAITPEIVREWQDLRADLPPFRVPRIEDIEPMDDSTGDDEFDSMLQELLKAAEKTRDELNLPSVHVLDHQSLIKKIRAHYEPALKKMELRYAEDKIPDMIHVPARLRMENNAQARRIMKFLAENNQKAFIRIGRLVAPDGTVLLEETNQARSLRRQFKDTDNLFLVPMRNPLAYRNPTRHARSSRVPDELYPLKTEHELVGKGVGLAFAATRRGVVASFRRGGGVHKFYGGLDEEEKAVVENAETSMKENFRNMMCDADWRDLAEFFHITEDNLFLSSVAEFQPLALPAYLNTQKSRIKFRGKTVELPGKKLPFGLKLIRTQPLLEHMNIGQIAAYGGTAKTSEVQRLYYYLTPKSRRILEMPDSGFPKGSYPVPYAHAHYVDHIGISWMPQGPKAAQPIVFKDAVTNQELPEQYVRQFVYVGLIVRTAIVARILHHHMDAAATNKWGSIFNALNMSPITVFDYDTINRRGDRRFTDAQIKKFQDEDEVIVWGLGGLLDQFADIMGADTMFERAWKEDTHTHSAEVWRGLHSGIPSLLANSPLFQEQIGKRLAEFLEQCTVHNAKPMTASGDEGFLIDSAA